MSDAVHRFGDEEQTSMLFEGEETIKEIAFAVNLAKLSSVIPPSDYNVYINLTTKEKEDYCIELSGLGFRVVSQKFDQVTIPEECSKYYETAHALLNDISPLYMVSFSEALSSKLRNLQNDPRFNDCGIDHHETD